MARAVERLAPGLMTSASGAHALIHVFTLGMVASGIGMAVASGATPAIFAPDVTASTGVCLADAANASTAA